VEAEPLKHVIVKFRLPDPLVKSIRSRLIAFLIANWVEDYIGDMFETFSERSD
jgi:hypothetical protein